MSNFRSYSTDKMPPVVKTLIIINVAVFIGQSLMGLTSYLALYPLGTPYFSSYQMLTHMFTHGGLGHIFFNMFALWMFGRTLENVWGGKRFLAFYMMCGIGAAVLHLIVEYVSGGGSPAVGASGAVMGIFVAFALLFPNTELYLMFIPIPIKAKWAMLGLIVFDLFGGLQGTDNIAHFAHLGGALTGAIMVLLWNKDRSRFY
jgi:membrane associated rhomboid family serine protease